MIKTPPIPARFIASKSAVMPSRVMFPFSQNQYTPGRADSGGWTNDAASWPVGVSVWAELAKTAHARGHPDQPLKRVKLVQALVEQHAAAFAFPRRAPAAAGVVGLGAEPVRDDPVDAHDFADHTVPNQQGILL
jgi:hypothetical protein